LDDILLPKSQYGDRMNVGRDAQGLGANGDVDDDTDTGVLVVSAQDPRLAFTYGEFPLESLDCLVDAAEPHLRDASTRNCGRKKGGKRTVIDLGSGCGRLALYLALSRGQDLIPNTNDLGGWDIAGIECSSLLHIEALRAANRAVQASCLLPLPCSASKGEGSEPSSGLPLTSRETLMSASGSTLTLVLGLVQDRTGWLCDADLVFAYSSTWNASRFSPETGSLLLSDEWQHLLDTWCTPGCVVITTDRSLDATVSAGKWKMIGQMEVCNPEVGGSSTGYIQRRLPPP
jgi:hypothetical protein